LIAVSSLLCSADLGRVYGYTADEPPVPRRLGFTVPIVGDPLCGMLTWAACLGEL